MQREESGQANTLDNYKFYDGFGRFIQNKKEAKNQEKKGGLP